MSNEFGEFDTVKDIELTDEWFEQKAFEPSLPEGEMLFYIDHYEPHPSKKEGSNSFGYDFFFVPYKMGNGENVSLAGSSKPLKKYFYMGKIDEATKQLYDSANAGFTKVFFVSIGIGAGEGKVVLSQQNVKGIVVRGVIAWEKLLSNRENPNTGKLPEAINENDVYSYFTVAKIVDGSIRGVRNEDGSIQKVLVA